MKAEYFGAAEKKYFSISKKYKLEDKKIKKKEFDDCKNSTNEYKKTAPKKIIFKYEIKD
jgi:hypothetical protein